MHISNAKCLNFLIFLIVICFCNTSDNLKIVEVPNPLTNPVNGPAAGNQSGNYPIPEPAGLEDVLDPDIIVGTGTPESVTSDNFIDAVARGGVITFNSGGSPVTIMLEKTAKVFNDASDYIVIDGGGMVTLSGCGARRILYMNTCDSIQHWTTSHCNNQETPRLTVQNLTFVDGNSTSETKFDGGGAIWIRGGRFKAVNCRFFNNGCKRNGPDVGGAAIRVFDQYNDLPVYLVNCTFGGAEGYGNKGANGGAISSIGVSWAIYNCLFSYNKALGSGGNPAKENTPGGGSGGAIYNDGNFMTLSIYGSRIEYNSANTHGSAIFFVSNDHSGSIHIENSVIQNNIGGSWYTLPAISMHTDTKKTVVNSTIK